MKIDANTISILKNFSKINSSIIINPGNVLKTVSITKTIMAKANISVSFEKKFAIYNLDRFISTLSLFNEPELSFNDKFVTISEGNKKTNYVYADEETIKVKPPEKEITLPSVDVTFKLTNDHLKNVEKALSVLGLPEIVVSGDGTNINLQAADVKNPSGDVYSIVIGETDKTFKAVFKAENIKIIPGDYDVSICSKGISYFKNDVVEYYIAVEGTSSF